MKPLTLNQEHFISTAIANSQTVLVDFRVAWLGPCKMIAPVLNELAVEKAGALNAALAAA